MLACVSRAWNSGVSVTYWSRSDVFAKFFASSSGSKACAAATAISATRTAIAAASPARPPRMLDRILR